MEEIVRAIEARLEAPRTARVPLLVGVDGPGGAGKSTFAADLTRALDARGIGAATVPVDDFYRPSDERRADPAGGEPGSAFDWQRLRDQVLRPLRRCEGVRYRRYDWAADALVGWRSVPGAQVVIVEGVTALRRELRAFYDLTVWIACPRSVRLARGIARDGEEARVQWEGEWMPDEDRYAARHGPEAAADLVVANADPHGTAHGWIVQGRDAIEGADPPG